MGGTEAPVPVEAPPAPARQDPMTLPDGHPLKLFFIHRFRIAATFAIFVCVLVLGIISAASKPGSGTYLVSYGIWPRTGWGLVGIFLAPVLSPTVPQAFLSGIGLGLALYLLSLYRGPTEFFYVTLWVLLWAGGLTWLAGRASYAHVGGEGLVLGACTYLLLTPLLSVFEAAPLAWASALFVVYLVAYGAAYSSGTEAGQYTVSWELAVCGLLAGLAASALYWHVYLRWWVPRRGPLAALQSPHLRLLELCERCKRAHQPLEETPAAASSSSSSSDGLARPEILLDEDYTPGDVVALAWVDQVSPRDRDPGL